MQKSSTFQNQLLRERDLPNSASLSFEGLPKAHWYSQLLVWTLVFTALIAVNVGVNTLSGNIEDFPTEINGYPTFLAAGIVSVLLYAFGVLVTWVGFSKKGYCLREQDIHYQKGVVWHVTKSLPYVRIQHIELETGPIERLFGLTTMKFYSAGGGGADLKVSGLTEDTAQKMRTYVLSRAKDLTAPVAMTESNGETHA